LYSFARKPDLTFFFNVPLAVALRRILDGRPQLKYHEAGMDLGLSPDPYESFELFQGRIYEEYQRMSGEFGFLTIDAGRPPEVQQDEVRQIVLKNIDLPSYKWRGHR
jgi:dTMP kinase